MLPLFLLESIDEVLQIIVSKGYRNVGLQFPDNMLCYSQEICQRLKESSNVFNVFVLADTSYGNCCVDEVAAQHANVDFIVHYGHSCLSKITNIPTHLVFEREHLDLEILSSSLCEYSKSNREAKILVLYDTVYEHLNFSILHSDNVLFSTLNRSCSEIPNTKAIQGRYFSPEFDYNTILYIGKESLTQASIFLSNSNLKCLCYSDGLISEQAMSKMLMKRYHLINKAKNANIIGILIGTLGVSKYMRVLERLKQSIAKAGKKYYVMVVGKINVPKLANFMEVDIYVLVACPENSLIDSKEFFKPIVTPNEMEMALDPEFTSNSAIKLAFEDYLATAPPEFEDSDALNNENDSNALIGSTGGGVVKYDSTGYFNTRSFKGLDPKIDEYDLEIHIGRRGIARGYTDEPEK
jgi:diphthamide biosynthesis protein 2